MPERENKPELPADSPTPKPELPPDKPNPTILPPPLEEVDYAERWEDNGPIDLDTSRDFRQL